MMNNKIDFNKKTILITGGAGFVIAFGNFEGTFYRYIKLTEAQKNWTHPITNPIHKPNK